MKYFFLARASRGLVTFAVLVGLWQAMVTIFQPAHYILPSPLAVIAVFNEKSGYFAYHAAITLEEMMLGFAVGSLGGMLLAPAMAKLPVLDRFIMPLVVASQTLPVFAIAPLLVIWFGFGIGSKIVMSALIIFFPVACAFYDGLKSTPAHFLDLSRSWGASGFQEMRLVAIPAALPQLGSGLKIAAAIAPIGAVVGEWAGASGGLGYIMLQANARMQTAEVFAALVILAITAFALRFVVVKSVDYLVFWNKHC